jgi:archaellum component FlaG (FlaF/FlaG flagellin family)
MKNNNTFAIIAIAAVAALLIATTVVSSLTNQAFAVGHKRTSYHQTAAQSCVNQNARCQNLLGQIQGHDNAGTVVGNQP